MLFLQVRLHQGSHLSQILFVLSHRKEWGIRFRSLFIFCVFTPWPTASAGVEREEARMKVSSSASVAMVLRKGRIASSASQIFDKRKSIENCVVKQHVVLPLDKKYIWVALCIFHGLQRKKQATHPALLSTIILISAIATLFMSLFNWTSGDNLDAVRSCVCFCISWNADLEVFTRADRVEKRDAQRGGKGFPQWLILVNLVGGRTVWSQGREIMIFFSPPQ